MVAVAPPCKVITTGIVLLPLLSVTLLALPDVAAAPPTVTVAPALKTTGVIFIEPTELPTVAE